MTHTRLSPVPIMLHGYELAESASECPSRLQDT